MNAAFRTTGSADVGETVKYSTFVRSLVKTLQKHADVLADSIPGKSYDQTDYIDRVRRGGAWAYLTAIVAWAEDHNLIDPWLREGLTVLHGMPPAAAIARAASRLTVHPATQWILHPQYWPELHARPIPDGDALAELVGWWTTAPALAYDVPQGPPSISGWLLGDLLQLATDERRKTNALVQSPWWVADFILDLALIPACQEYRDERLIRAIDPTCGTGNMLIRAMDYLWEWYATGTLHPRQARIDPATGGTGVPPERVLGRVIASVDGIELDPLTAAIARLRCTVYAGHLAHRAGVWPRQPRMHEIPRTLIPRIGVGDSLLLGQISQARYAQLHPTLADLPGASFTCGDWWADEPSPANTQPRPTPLRPAQLSLWEAA